MFTVVSVLHITGVEVSEKKKCAKQTAISNILKNCISVIHSVRYVGHYDLKEVHHS